MKLNKVFIDKLLAFGAELSEEVCEIQTLGFETMKKEDSSPLTEADLHSNKRIRDFCLQIRMSQILFLKRIKKFHINSALNGITIG